MQKKKEGYVQLSILLQKIAINNFVK